MSVVLSTRMELMIILFKIGSMPLDIRGANVSPVKLKEQTDPKDNKKFQTPRLEDTLAESYDYFWNIGKGHFFYRESAGSLHARSFIEDRNKNLLFILPGRSESSLKYAELAYELRGQGFDIIILDHRGQGLSERLNGASDYVHIESFDHYVEDLNEVMEHFCASKKYRAKHLMAHSMGSAVALRHIQKYGPDHWDGVILSSPMLKIKSSKIPLFIALWISKFYLLLGKQFKPIWNRQIQDSKRKFSSNNVTHCGHRFTWARKMEEIHPHILSGAPTMQWLYESILVGKKIMKDRTSFKKPILLMQADQDVVVCNQAQNKFAHQIENCRIIRLKECKHEVLQETNAVRNRALVQITQFLKNLA